VGVVTGRLAALVVAEGAAALAGLTLLVLLWFRPHLALALLAGLFLSLTVAVPWSFIAALAVGPTGPLDATPLDPAGTAARFLAGPTGNSAELAGVVIGLCMSCSLLAGWRSRPRRKQPEGEGS
jgi:hypothetical protein